MSTNHNWFQLICIYFNFGAVVCTLLVILTDIGIHYEFQEVIPYLLNNGTAHVSSAYPTPISPVSWVYITWLGVYTWMLMWSFHAVIMTCRTFAGVPVYVNPSLINTPMLMFSIGACATTVTWFCVYDREYISTATLFSLSTTCMVWSAYFVSVYTLHIGMYKLEKGDRHQEAWLHRFLVQNGLAMLGTWSFLVTMLNLCTAVIHNKDIKMDPDTATVICLSIVTFWLVLVAILDVTVLDRFTRYTFLHYAIPIIVLIGCIFRQDTWADNDVVFIMLATLLAFSFLQTMIKAACVSCRLMASPKETHNMSELEGLSPYSQPIISAYTPSTYLSEDQFVFEK